MIPEQELMMWLIKSQGIAYRQLVQGSQELLENHSLFWTERLLLRLVRNLYQKRLRDTLVIAHPDDTNEILGAGPE
jgi:hypothetical protein